MWFQITRIKKILFCLGKKLKSKNKIENPAMQDIFVLVGIF